MPRAFTADVVEGNANTAGADLQDQCVLPVGLKVADSRRPVGIAAIRSIDHLRPERSGDLADGVPEIEEDRHREARADKIAGEIDDRRHLGQLSQLPCPQAGHRGRQGLISEMFELQRPPPSVLHLCQRLRVRIDTPDVGRGFREAGDFVVGLPVAPCRE